MARLVKRGTTLHIESARGCGKTELANSILQAHAMDSYRPRACIVTCHKAQQASNEAYDYVVYSKAHKGC